MRVFRFSRLLIVPAAAALTLSACTALYARDLRPAASGDPDPKYHECVPCAQHLRDSVFHSYMDSLDYRISALNDVARRVDSLSKLFKGHPNWKLFMDGKTFGPMHFPETHLPSTKLSEIPNIEIPEITIPEVNIPSIEIPEIDINLDTSNLSELTKGVSKLSELAGVVSGMVSGTADLDGNGFISGTANANPQSSSDSFYDSNSGSRYYIRNAPPAQKAKRAKPDGNIWLLNAK